MARRCPAPRSSRPSTTASPTDLRVPRTATPYRQPEKYLPQYGGYCAFAMAKGALAKTDPEAFTVIEGKLYLNFNEGVRQRWLPRSSEFIHAADLNWPQVRGE